MTEKNPENQIDPLAVVSPGAKIGDKVTIEAFAVVKENVTIGDNVKIMSHAYIDGHTTIGEGTTIYPSAVIGTQTQDKKFKGELTYVKVGKNCDIREYVTINASCGEGSLVEVGDHCLIMAYCHVAHQCIVGNNVIMSNGATLAGHVTVDDNAIIGGLTAVHQFSRIGAFAMVGGMSRVTHDVSPYTIGGGSPYKFGGINLVGLKRSGVPLAKRKLLSETFRILYRSGCTLEEAIDKIETEIEQIPEIAYWLDFCKTSQRGLLGVNAEPS